MTTAAIVGVGAVGPARQAGEGAARRQTRPVPGPRVPQAGTGRPAAPVHRPPPPPHVTDLAHVTDLGHDHVRFVPVPVTKIRNMWGPAVGSPRTAPGGGGPTVEVVAAGQVG